MPALNLDLDYLDHRKTKRLVGLLGRGSEWLPVRLWIYCGKFHAESGALTGYSAQEIEAQAGWWGKPGEAIAALVKVGFLDETPDEYKVHNWEKRAAHMAIYKAKASAAGKKRWALEREKIRRLEAEAQALKDAPSSAPSTTPSTANAGQCSARQCNAYSGR